MPKKTMEVLRKERDDLKKKISGLKTDKKKKLEEFRDVKKKLRRASRRIKILAQDEVRTKPKDGEKLPKRRPRRRGHPPPPEPMALVAVLLVTGLAVSLLNIAGTLEGRETPLRHLVLFVEHYRVAAGCLALAAAFANGVNVWMWGTDDYPLLTWIVVFANGLAVLDKPVRERLNVSGGPLAKLLDFLERRKTTIGWIGIATVAVKTLSLADPVVRLLF